VNIDTWVSPIKYDMILQGLGRSGALRSGTFHIVVVKLLSIFLDRKLVCGQDACESHHCHQSGYSLSPSTDCNNGIETHRLPQSKDYEHRPQRI
jgi:hypothetical protein